MKGSDPVAVKMKSFAVLASHLLLCLACLFINMARYPLGHSLYYWWFAPFDMAAILVVTPFYLCGRLARLGYCLNSLISLLEVTALVYLGATLFELPFMSNGSAFVAWLVAILVVLRIPIGWLIAGAALPFSTPSRGCV